MKVIDLSLLIHSNMETYPGDPLVKIDVVHRHKENTWELRELKMGSHTGTHVDAFSHMHQNKASLDDISLTRFFGKAMVTKPNDEFINNIGLLFIKEVDINYLNKILDAKANFVGGNITEELQRALLANNIITYTNLVNLDLLPKNKTFMFYGLPLKIKNGDGSPVRAIAIIDN